VSFAAVCKSEVLGACEVPDDAFGRLPVCFAGVVEELRDGQYSEPYVRACDDGRIHETANGFSVGTRFIRVASSRFEGASFLLYVTPGIIDVLTNLALVRLK
jgi:hypothetical protein